LHIKIPITATVFGDPHFYTFDGMAYTFNGKGEYVLVRADSPRVKLDVQGRFEQVKQNTLGVEFTKQFSPSKKLPLHKKFADLLHQQLKLQIPSLNTVCSLPNLGAKKANYWFILNQSRKAIFQSCLL